MSAEASKAKADGLVAQAEKRLNSWLLFFFNSSKNEVAAELLEKAANNYKLAKACRVPFSRCLVALTPTGKEAADTFKQLAEIYTKIGSQHEAATAYVEASKVLTRIQPEGQPTDPLISTLVFLDAVVVLHQAVEIYTDMGRLNQAARYIRVQSPPDHIQF